MAFLIMWQFQVSRAIQKLNLHKSFDSTKIRASHSHIQLQLFCIVNTMSVTVQAENSNLQPVASSTALQIFIAGERKG